MRAGAVVASTPMQQVALIVLRSLIGWHFLYEGYVKLLGPAWTRAGVPLQPFSSAGYLRNATGPFADVFRGLADSPWLPTLDLVVALALFAAGVSLVVGLFTQAGSLLAFGLLTVFYLSAIPLQGVAEPRNEGTYLIVNKNLIEAAAVALIFVFRTGRIAGLDRWLAGRRAPAAAHQAAA
jgi:thiosulfate dehydrogenase [quinone] large subunit